jgi:hypothetical protein
MLVSPLNYILNLLRAFVESFKLYVLYIGYTTFFAQLLSRELAIISIKHVSKPSLYTTGRVYEKTAAAPPIGRSQRTFWWQTTYIASKL